MAAGPPAAGAAGSVVLVVSLLLPLLLLEAALRLLGPVLPGNYNTGTFLTPHPVYGRFHVPGFDGWVKTREYTVRVTINQQGLRGPERPYAETSRGHPHHVSWRLVHRGRAGARAGRHRQPAGVGAEHARNGRYEVLNGGVGGWGTGQQLVYLREEGTATSQIWWW